MTTHDPTTTDLEALLGGQQDWKRFLPWLGGFALLVVAGLTAYVLTTGGETAAAVAPEATEASTGTITSTTSLSGTAAAAQSADLTFGAAGVVAQVSVAVGDAVLAGDLLAVLEDTEAARQVETAQIALDQANANFEALLADPETADLASAVQSIRAAESQVASAALSLDRLLEPADATEVLAAEQGVATALSQLSSAEAALADVEAGTNATELASAQSAVSNSEAQLANATNSERASFDSLDQQQNAYCAYPEGFADVCATWALPLSPTDIARLEASKADASTFLLATIDPFIQASTAYEGAVANLEGATTSLESALVRLTEVEAGPSSDELFRAQQGLAAAQSSYQSALLRLDDVQEAAAITEVNQATASAASAQASLSAAQARYSELVGGTDVSDIERQEQSVRLAEISLERAMETLADLQIVAPFDGVVGAVEVSVGDSVGSNIAAISLNTPDRMTIDLTVSEAEVLELQVGQTGLATFNAIDDTQYPVRIVSVSTIPTVSAGVVTYAVSAVLLEPNEIAEVASDLQVLAGGSTDLGGAGAGIAAGAGRGGAGAVGRGGGAAPGAALADIELPEGVTIQDVVSALSAGEPLPAGVELPDGFELPAGFADRGAGTPPDAADGTAFAAADRVLPLPGMSGSVEVLLGVRNEVLLIPSTAVRSQGATSYVVIENAEGEFERLTVTTGESSGTSVEVLAGLEAGETVWLNASAPATGEFSLENVDTAPATDQPQAPPGGGFGGGAGGGGRAGGAAGGGQ